MSKLMLYGLLLLNILLLSGGQIVWKNALQNMSGGLSLTNVLTSPGIYLGGFMYVIATGLWLVVLNNMKLSTAYPLQSFAYVIGILSAWLIFGESIPTTRWIGGAVILAGVFLVSLE
ncbi:EamA family transporter [Tumebacillus permanentifrigoris]|jgi:drug/metabolite transporter (DMT)-like permease|uniref:EamA-like transporter family protein n=1 Tax=Tumebacillus permanentifrigoris TaxID=378543 RepID=A0A316D2M9_9BACL|nr:EamA family transporter [Tumebacillus permanentifrigoris]PWK05160.1 EamA-like transporter family protein [Tumebacillus permanentifrigoris]